MLAEPPVAGRVAELGQHDLVLETRFRADSRRPDFTATQATVRAEIVAALTRLRTTRSRCRNGS